MNAHVKKPFADAVAERLIEQLKAGTAPWQKPWEHAGYLPLNPTTGKRYRGINVIQLLVENRGDPRWMTYKQALDVKAQVRRGEKGTTIQYWKFHDEKNALDDEGRPIKDKDGQSVKTSTKLERPAVFFATVFNAEQIDGLPPLQRKTHAWAAIERADAILKNSGASIAHKAGDRAYYSPSTDSITLPLREQFPTPDRYYSTALHELGHWTGHESRLARDIKHGFGTQAYAREELRAEIASMLMGEELGLGHDPGQHAAYVKTWIQAIQNDHMEIFRASADAEKIHAYLMGFDRERAPNRANENIEEAATADKAIAARLAAASRAVGETLKGQPPAIQHEVLQKIQQRLHERQRPQAERPARREETELSR
jgi:antirestriction protein ArdC